MEDHEAEKEIDLKDNLLMASWILDWLRQMDTDLHQAGLDDPGPD
ncbi:MAG TPA: hypothetical protein PKM27_16705 [Saprospiraceae bacterium]|nr:hypothetical protein [Saprospiraceae bacterium]HNT21280.1 hypothetical protein [Saprospiraceae bacterium]